ncbi:MAG: PAM68 family protein, partial [Phormidesmis sp.]
MASKSDRDENTDRAGLPFEPNGKKGKPSGAKSPAPKISAKAQAQVDEILSDRQRSPKAAQRSSASTSNRSASRATDRGAIPEAVSRRMLRRMAILSGSPVFLGVGIFFLAYYLQSRQIVEFPPVAVLLVTMGCFGLGVLGLTYGVMSASWDSEP